MYAATYEQYGLRLSNAAIAEHAVEITAFADATAIRTTYGSPLNLSESFAHTRMLRALRTKSATLLHAQAEWAALAHKDDDPDGDWDDFDHTPGDGPWKWQLGAHKSAQKWENQMRDRKWPDKQITDAIAHGKEFPAPNNINPNNPAIRYELSPNRFVVRDEVIGRKRSPAIQMRKRSIPCRKSPCVNAPL